MYRKARRLRLAAALGTLLAGALAASDSPPRAELTDFTWSEDGSRFVVAEARTDGRGPLRVYDAAGRAVASLSGSRLDELFGGDPSHVAVSVAAEAKRVLVERQNRFAVWTPADDSLRLLPALHDLVVRPLFSPDGNSLAFARDGDLHLLDLESLVERPLTDDGSAIVDGLLPRSAASRRTDPDEPGFAWSPGGDSVALFRTDSSGAVDVAVVDLISPSARRMEVPATDLPLRLHWRFDAKALAIETLAPNRGELVLLFCHPQKEYCREFAARPWKETEREVDSLRFLGDGLVWAIAGDVGPSLHFFDPLGRDRRALLAPGERLVSVEGVFDATHEVAALVARPSEEGLVRLFMIDDRNGRGTEVASGGAWPLVRISGPTRSWVRPHKGADERFDGYLLERIDGTKIRSFALDGSSNESPGAAK